jgi:hypothetical protein
MASAKAVVVGRPLWKRKAYRRSPGAAASVLNTPDASPAVTSEANA